MRLRLLLTLGLAASLLVWAVPAPVAASTACQGSVSNYFDGLHTADYTTYGSYAYIKTYPLS
jgi:hypothetical protein